MPATTTLKLPLKRKARIARLASLTQRSPRGWMLKPVSREVERVEHWRKFLSEAAAADRAIDRGAPVYAAHDVHAWLRQLAANGQAKRPEP